MAAISSPIDLSLLPAPAVVEPLNYEEILETHKARLISLFASEDREAVAKALALESRPLTILLQENSERKLTLRQRVNEAARSVLMAFAYGADLEKIAAEYGVIRLTVTPEDLSTIQPSPVVMESDDGLRFRAQMAWEGLSTAGPRGAYEFHARSAHGQISDVSSISPKPCDILISALPRLGNGAPSQEVLNAVRVALNDEDVRPQGDRVTVQASQIKTYAVRAILHMKGQGSGRAVALAAALHVEGVDHLELLEPASDILLNETHAGTCTSVEISMADGESDA